MFLLLLLLLLLLLGGESFNQFALGVGPLLILFVLWTSLCMIQYRPVLSKQGPWPCPCLRSKEPLTAGVPVCGHPLKALVCVSSTARSMPPAWH
ncbi:hypothetical protein F5144DRAFT_572294 [Chaetomium tenue]|uniref:Uncharacterized protein n=1 Tax=Chaetomium tenue TaxID=1854479 RepID=A0ACB7PB95_9PEZI|nr:hypothetical protein F5144DRAFT_572294 [Chaetomium globosum]